MKNTYLKFSLLISLSIAILYLCSCKKYLEAKPDQTLTTPSTIQDLRALLDNNTTMNLGYASFSEVLSDNYYVTSENWATQSDILRANYIWEKNDNTSSNWANYTAIYYSNIILESLPKLDFNAAQEERNSIMGSALFLRGFYFYSLSQLFAPPFNQNTATSKYGIPLRLNTDFDAKSVRSTVAETYEQILSDLKASVLLLPIKTLVKTRPSKPAAFGMIAKVYLSMQKYDSAGVYADKCLSLHDSLLNLNTDVTVSASAPFKRFNKEVIFHARSNTASILAPARAKIDSTLYKSYGANDLRKTAYFKTNTGINLGTYAFKGDYDGSGTSSGFVFGGVVSDEIYLIRAECRARAGNKDLALEDLNKLLINRFSPPLYTCYCIRCE